MDAAGIGAAAPRAAPNVVDVHVAALRRKLAAGAIETVRGAGYGLADGG